MADAAVLRSSLVWLAVVVGVVGLYTDQSIKKMVATYVFGMLGVAGLVLPDWDYFDRPVSQWISPLSVDDLGPPPPSSHSPTAPTRFRFYPIRTIIYGVVYGFALYKWWKFISS